MKIMIVEDSEPMRAYIKRFISTHVANVDAIVETANGAEAIQQYAKVQPDFVVMDVEMEKVDGITATSIIKAFDAKARVVVLTGHDDAAYRNAAQKAGADAYVLKENISELAPILAAQKPM